MKTVIVGGVAAGASTGARPRRLDDSAGIAVLERVHYVSCANSGLPYHIGGAIPDRDSVLLMPAIAQSAEAGLLPPGFAVLGSATTDRSTVCLPGTRDRNAGADLNAVFTPHRQASPGAEALGWYQHRGAFRGGCRPAVPRRRARREWP
jgi:hypothetical protein